MAVAVVAIGLGVVVTAQIQDPQQPPAAEQTDPSTQAPIFRSGVTLVTTDVIVRDEDGVFLADLTTDDFQVYEDGNRQEIASLVLVHGGRVYNQLLPLPPPVQEGIILPAARPVNDTAGRIFIFFIDDLHLQTSLTPRARQVFKRITDTLVHEGDMFGVVSTGTSSISIDMTYDRGLLEVAMDKITGSGFSPSELIRDVQQGRRGPEEVRWRAHVAFKTAREIVRNLEHVQNRRKAFIYLSSGYDFNPFGNSRLRLRDAMMGQNSIYDGGDPLRSPFDRLDDSGAVFADSDLQMELFELTKLANRANASFYTVDPRGLVAGPGIDYQGPHHEWNQFVLSGHSSLRVLAQLTGGKAIVNRNDYEDAFLEIDAETSDYYVLGFYSSNPDPTFRTRQLDVEVSRENATTVRARTHYTYPRADER